MNKFIYLLFVSIFLLDYFHGKLNVIPGYVTLLPELLSLFAVVVVSFCAATNKSFSTKAKYIVFFLVYISHIVIGIILNTVPPGAIFAGLRTYLKFFPFFFLPAVYNFSDNQVKNQLTFLLVLSIVQCPLALYQRFFQFKGLLTGDVVTGTLNICSILSIYLICSIAVLLAFYLKKKITFSIFLLFLFLLFIPTTVNETKGSLILLPVAIVSTILFTKGKSSKFKQYVTIPILGVILIIIFVPIYDHFIKPRWGYGIVDFFQMEGRVEGYFYKSATGSVPGEKIGRADSLVLAFKELSDDPIKLSFGLGIGNVTGSYFRGFQGEYTHYQRLGVGMSSLSNLLWEIGLVGVILYSGFFYLVFTDALYLRRREDISGTLALGWIGVLIVLGMSLLYKNMIHHNINYLFWYFSGYIASKRANLERFEGGASR